MIDVHRGDAAVERNPLRVGLYIALFPQLIAGPIVRYREIAAALRARAASLDDLTGGARRFVIGLGKKVLIANTLAVPTDAIFALPPEQLSAAVAWLGALTYALQIYFDFSGYSDMAIGLGRHAGLPLPREFPHPLLRRQRARVLAPLAHLALDLVSRLSLHSPGRKPRLGRASHRGAIW